MTKKTAYWIFILGTLASLLVLLALTIDFHREVGALTHSDQISSQVLAGKRVWQKYNCNDCHTMLGFGGYYGPDMTRVYLRIGEAGIRFAVEKPEQAFSNSFRKMPNLHLKPEEIDNLTAFFKWASGINNNYWPPQDRKYQTSSTGVSTSASTSSGEELFKVKGCINCHTLKGEGGNIGPVLTGIGSKLTKDFIAQYITDPAKVNPKAQMPNLHLSPDEINTLSEFLSSQK
ncbi:MAG TPA: c-type cytochrome [Terriglobales bacterium]|nr:c-type cytochrome [Terriglobales bacterium]